MNQVLIEHFLTAQSFATDSKFSRWLRKPWKYATGMLWTYAVNRLFPEAIATVTAVLFTGDRIFIPLPAGLDLYLTGVKSHVSELRLTRFLLSYLKPGDVVVDAGAHLGYYTLIMAHCVTDKGQVVAFEPTKNIGSYLIHNTRLLPQVNVEQQMVGITDGEAAFTEYPILYSEFNSSLPDTQTILKGKTRLITSARLDTYCTQHELVPTFLKIDVEGNELNTLKGAEQILESITALAIEIRKPDYDRLYAPVDTFLREKQFLPNRITDEGKLTTLSDGLGSYINGIREESDNIVFQKLPS